MAYKDEAGRPDSAEPAADAGQSPINNATPAGKNPIPGSVQFVSCRMAAVQVSGVTMPLMLSLLLGAYSSVWPLAPAAAFQLPPCQLVNQTVSLEKEGCPRCHTVETTICSGHCVTKDPVVKIPFGNVYQHVCTYRDSYHRTFELPDCPPGVDPTVTYPVALSCHCGRCAMDTSDCTFESLQPDFCMNDIPFYY